MSHKNLLKALKAGIIEQLSIIEKPTLMGLSAKDDKKIIAAQKAGILGAQKMIFEVYKYSTAERINESTWITKHIKKLVTVSADPKKRLLEAIKAAYSDEDEDGDAKTFYDNKTHSIDDYNEIDDAVSGLNVLLDSADEEGNIVIKDRSDFKASWPENNADKKSKAGYREDIDAVVIDPNGTVGEIREVYGLRIALPRKPVKGEFTNYSVKEKEDQHWTADDLPHGLVRDTEDNYKDYIEDQYDKKNRGVWFYNNGEPTYITGAHWFLLQWCKTDADDDGIHGKGKFHYRTAHRDIFYFAEAVWVDKRSLGLVYVKTRRTGATFCLLGFGLCKAIGTSWKNFGMTSKTDTDAKNNFNNKMMPMFSNLPFFFKPIRLSDSPKKVLEFKEPQRRITKSNKNQDEAYEALMTEISYRSTTEDAYDGDALAFYLGDEFSKWKKPNDILEHWRMLSRAMTKGGKITGKGYLISTVENVNGFDDPHDKAAGTGDKYNYLYENSDMKNRNANGKTASGLYQLFIPCDENFEGFIDMYGNPIKNTPEKPILGVDGQYILKGINEYLEEEAASKTTNDERYNFWRLNPRTVNEAFRVAADDSIFDLEKLTRQFDYNEGRDNLWIQGDFEWVDGVIPAEPSEARVEFIPKPNGKFKVSWIPDPQYQNAKIKQGNKVFPANGFAGSLGCDPYRASETVNRKGSNGAIHGCNTAGNPIGPTDKLFLEYCYRPESVKVFSWDVIKAAVFYGMPVLVENSVTDTLRYMEEWGYRWYSMDRPDKKPKDLTKHERELGGYPASPDIIDRLTNTTVWFVDKFAGNEDCLDKIPFNDTINDWIKYQSKNRTRHDMTVSSSLAIFASRKQSVKREVTKKTIPQGLVKTYKREGYLNVKT